MDLTPREKNEIDAATRIIRAVTADDDMESSIVVLLAIAKAIGVIELEQKGAVRATRWRDRADMLAPRMYELISKLWKGEWRLN
jgi:hypothetical protein